MTAWHWEHLIQSFDIHIEQSRAAFVTLDLIKQRLLGAAANAEGFSHSPYVAYGKIEEAICHAISPRNIATLQYCPSKHHPI
jgi:hypothetical protein